jgi:hypothetical protein
LWQCRDQAEETPLLIHGRTAGIAQQGRQAGQKARPITLQRRRGVEDSAGCDSVPHGWRSDGLKILADPKRRGCERDWFDQTVWDGQQGKVHPRAAREQPGFAHGSAIATLECQTIYAGWNDVTAG